VSAAGWLRALPRDWKTKRADAVLDYRKTPARVDDFASSEVFHYSIPAIQETGDGIVQHGADIDSDKIQLEGGELIVSKLNPHKGCVLLTRRQAIPVVCSTEFVPLVARPGFEARFAYYTYLSAPVRELISAEVKSATRSHQRASPEDITKIWLPVPPLQQQRAIVGYLDAATQRIDCMVAAKERVHGLLAEKAQALIADAVTRGLNLRCPRRDSGVSWLGEIPAHWEIERTRWLFRERDVRSETGEEEMLTVSHLTGVTPRSEKDVNMFEAETTKGYKLCERGDLVINTLWAWMGAMGVAPIRGIVSPAYNVYEPGRRLLPAYIDALVRLPVFAQEVTRYSKGVWSSRLRLYPEGFFEVHLPVPPLHEQEAIVQHIARETVKLDKLRAATEASIALLKERRAALIAAAVTGQIEVTEAP
jgi:type I restriction enzyme S subunit